MLSIQLTDDVEQRFDQLAKYAGQDTEKFISQSLVQLLEDLEDLYSADQAMMAYNAGEPTTSLNDLMVEYGLDN